MFSSWEELKECIRNPEGTMQAATWQLWQKRVKRYGRRLLRSLLLLIGLILLSASIVWMGRRLTTPPVSPFPWYVENGEDTGKALCFAQLQKQPGECGYAHILYRPEVRVPEIEFMCDHTLAYFASPTVIPQLHAPTLNVREHFSKCAHGFYCPRTRASVVTIKHREFDFEQGRASWTTSLVTGEAALCWQHLQELTPPWLWICEAHTECEHLEPEFSAPAVPVPVPVPSL